MQALTALLLGLVQGLTEFFPVSSSAHLKAIQLAFGLKPLPVLFDLACHLGSLCALIWFFKRDLLTLDRKKLGYLFLALLPLVPSYFLLRPLREFLSDPLYLGTLLMGTGLILFAGQVIQLKTKAPRKRDALLIGTMQAAALLPGISRSASTISAARMLGWGPKEAVRFSFLLAIPTILGGNVLEMGKILKRGVVTDLWSVESVIGFFVSFFVGLLLIRFAIKWLERGKLKGFAWYCLTAGAFLNLYMYLK